MSEHRRFLREVAAADPASLVGRFRTVDSVAEARRLQREVRRALSAGRHLRAVA